MVKISISHFWTMPSTVNLVKEKIYERRHEHQGVDKYFGLYYQHKYQEFQTLDTTLKF